MSKKLIAVAAAAALALTGLVAVPANANITVGFSIPNATDGADASQSAKIYGSSAEATLGSAVISVPANNVLEYTSTATRNSLLKVAVTTTVGEALTATTSGAAKIVASVNNADGTARDSTAGASSYSVTATTNSTVFYLFTTSSANQTLTIAKSGNTGVYHFKASRGLAHTVTATGPDSGAKGVTYKFSATVTDVFGNPVSSGLTITANGFVVDNLGAFTSAPTLVAGTNGTNGVWNFLGTVGATGAGLMTIAVGGTAAVAGNVTGLPDSSLTAVVSIGASDPAVQITALQAQVATLTAQMADMRTKARSVTKKKYNTLARKWNAANPGARVALK